MANIGGKHALNNTSCVKGQNDNASHYDTGQMIVTAKCGIPIIDADENIIAEHLRRKPWAVRANWFGNIAMESIMLCGSAENQKAFDLTLGATRDQVAWFLGTLPENDFELAEPGAALHLISACLEDVEIGEHYFGCRHNAVTRIREAYQNIAIIYDCIEQRLTDIDAAQKALIQ